MRPNAVKHALKAGKLQLGTNAGFPWAFIDTEHGGFDLETVQDVCRVSQLVLSCGIWRYLNFRKQVLAGLCPVVRVADLQYSPVAHLNANT